VTQCCPRRERNHAIQEKKRRTPVLTARETDVIYLLSRGCSYAVMADRLGISVHTVTSHIKNAYRKLSVRTAAAAVTRAAELGMLSGHRVTQ
jgi:DNA-binding CsgD family transcriptional regulator